MVGVPGRSKACSTCRRRKKGCDFQRPSCGQCRKARLQCGGYDRERIFVNTTQADASSEFGSTIAYARGSDVLPLQRHDGRQGWSSPSPEASTPLLWSAHEERVLGLFWETYLPNGRIFPTQATGYASGGWTNVVQSLYRDSTAVRYALLANCFSALGRRDDVRWMVEEGFAAYGRALRELRMAMHVPSRATSDGTLSAVRLMIMFAMFSVTNVDEDRLAQAHGWSHHNAGVLALLQARTPYAHVSGDGHQMFVDGRLPLIISAIKARKTSELSRPEWKTIPWSEHPKEPKDLLIDILADIPGLLEDMDRHREMEAGPAKDAARNNILKRCWTCDRQLVDWYDESAPTERYEAIEESGEIGLSAEDLSVVYVMALSWATSLLLYSTVRLLGLTTLPERTNDRIYVNKLARCMKYFFHPSTGQYGMEMATFPLGLALQFLSACAARGESPREEKAMFTKLFESDRGREILNFLTAMQRDSSGPKREGSGDAQPTTRYVGAWPFLQKEAVDHQHKDQ